jgi:excisionase family DNA binding protein
MRPERFVTIKEAAEMLEVTRSAIEQAIWGGKLPSQTVFGKIVIDRADLEAYRARTRPDGVKPRGRPKKKAVE